MRWYPGRQQLNLFASLFHGKIRAVRMPGAHFLSFLVLSQQAGKRQGKVYKIYKIKYIKIQNMYKRVDIYCKSV